MREMHKWKDKVELSLDNRQIFFLFFGLSVVGCFVFALGVMVGRRVEFGGVSEAEASQSGSLALLDAPTAEPVSYSQGLRDGDVPPPVAMPTLAETDPGAAPGADEASADPKAKAGDKPRAAAGGGPAKVAKADAAVMAGASSASVPAGARRFTLQMKAFAKPEEAEAFAAPLRSNGHDVRVEAHEIKGRIWHRVRMGEFETWEEGLTAKTDFEKSEKMIAYVVRL